MTIDASCPNCGTVFTVRRELIGKRTKCTRCAVPFVIAESLPSKPTFAPAPRAPDPGGFLDIADPIEKLPPEPVGLHDVPLAPATPSEARSFHGPAQPRRTAQHAFPDEAASYERAQPRPQFYAMRIVAKAYEIMGFIVLGVAVILLVLALVSIVRSPSIAVFVAYAINVFGAVLTALMLFFVSQAIRLWLQIEENTRETQRACRQLADHLCSIEVER